jgi:Family of unknown function (DUF5923)
MFSCLGFRKKKAGDEEALIPKHNDDTELQRQMHQKMRSYQLLRALSKGYMPSTEQLVINLRSLLASDVLNPENPDLSDSGHRLFRLCKLWLQQSIELLRNKNDQDQIQDFIWFLTKARVSLDVDDLGLRASKIKARAEATAGL